MRILVIVVVGLLCTATNAALADDTENRQWETLPPSFWINSDVPVDSLQTIRAYLHERGEVLKRQGTTRYVVGSVLAVAGTFILASALDGQEYDRPALVWPAVAVVGGGGFWALRGRTLRARGGQLVEWGEALDQWSAQKARNDAGR